MARQPHKPDSSYRMFADRFIGNSRYYFMYVVKIITYIPSG